MATGCFLKINPKETAEARGNLGFEELITKNKIKHFESPWRVWRWGNSCRGSESGVRRRKGEKPSACGDSTTGAVRRELTEQLSVCSHHPLDHSLPIIMGQEGTRRDEEGAHVMTSYPWVFPTVPLPLQNPRVREQLHGETASGEFKMVNTIIGPLNNGDTV